MTTTYNVLLENEKKIAMRRPVRYKNKRIIALPREEIAGSYITAASQMSAQK